MTISAMLVVAIAASSVRADEPVDVTRSAVVFDGHLLSLTGGGVGAWDLKTGTFSKEAAARFSRKGLSYLATGGDRLWAADESAVYRWSAGTAAWEKVAGYEEKAQDAVGLVLVGEKPLLVFPSRVADPVGGKSYPVPKALTPPFGEPPLRVLALHGTSSMLWVGTGNGEWGGTLFGLDPKTGTWVRERQGGSYVTGITSSDRDEVAVSWSMSHFVASTAVQVHKADATPRTENRELRDHYFQRLTYNPHDGALYAIDLEELVTVKDGKPTKVVELKERLYEREPKAMGVAPGVVALLPVGPRAVVVVPKVGSPIVVREGRVTTLKK